MTKDSNEVRIIMNFWKRKIEETENNDINVDRNNY